MTSQNADAGGSGPRACPECGTPSTPGQSFCDGCGAVLTWTSTSSRSGGPAARPGSSAATVPAAPGAGGAGGPGSTPGGSTAAGPGGPGGAAGFAAAGGPGAPGSTPGGSTAASGAGGVESAPTGPPGTAGAGAGGAGPAGLAGGADHASPAPGSAVSAALNGPAASGTGRGDGGPGATGSTGASIPSQGDRRAEAGWPGAGPNAAAASPDETPTAPLPPAATGASAGPAPEPDAASAAAAANERARALLVPVNDPQQQEAAPVIAPVLPGRPAAARPTVQSPGPELGDEGGTPCPWCGTGNRPDRHFCRRCAMSMEGRPEDPPKLAWWRRLPGFGPRRNPWAGERPRLRSDWSRVVSWVVMAAVLAGVITLAVNGGSVAQTVSDHFSKRVLIPPDTSKVTASNSYAQHGPQLAFDEHNNTWWGPGFTGDDAGRWIQAGFNQPVDLLDVVISPGESTNASDLDGSALPQNLEADVTTADGKVQTTTLTLDPNVGPQTRPLRFSNVVSVRFIIRSAYNASATKQVAIAEIEFFGPSRGSGS